MTLAFDVEMFLDHLAVEGGSKASLPTDLNPSADAAVLADAFRRAFRCHPAGVAVATTTQGGRPVGVTVSSLISLSAEPAVVAFSVSNSSPSGAALRRSASVVVHMMGPEHLDTLRLFSTPGVERFTSDLRWSTLPTGEPILEDAVVRLRGHISHRVDTGAATLLIVSLESIDFVASSAEEGVDALVYHNRNWFSLDSTKALPA